MFWRKRKRSDDDLKRELESHLAAEAEEQLESGVSSEEASYAARRLLGNGTAIREQVWESSPWIWLERLQQDTVYALRTFARLPGFTALVIVTLALGVGATSSIFSILDAVLLHPLPYKNPDRLVVVWEKLARDPAAPPVFDSYRDFLVWKKNSKSFEQLEPATWATGGQILTGIGPARDVLAEPVGLDFFNLLGVPAQIGRTFQADDLRHGCTVVLKHSFWMNMLGGNRNVVGRHVSLNEKPCTIIGVMPPEFTFYPDESPMWSLITPASELARDPDEGHVGAFGLLKPGVSIGQAQQEMRAIFQNEHRNDKNRLPLVPFVFPLAEQFAYLSGPTLRFTVVVLFAAVLFVLLIACANIANLLLGRSLARQKELMVRAALGSGRARLVRQLLTESLLLSFAGASLGVLFALEAVRAFRDFNPIRMPPGNPVSVNLPVLAFTSLLAVVTALLFGLLPAWKASRVDVAGALRVSAGTTSSAATRRIAKLLVASEVTLSLVLLTGAGLLIQSVNRLASVPLGFRTDHVALTSVVLPSWSYQKNEQRAGFYENLLERCQALPAIEAAAFASQVPLSGGGGRSALALEGHPEPTAATAVHDTGDISVSAAYFRVIGVPLERGRLFDRRDTRDGEAVAIVNRALVRKYFPHEDPLGRHIRVGEPGTKRPWLTVVGVTGDEKDKDFFHEMSWEDVPTVFRPLTQNPPLSGSLLLRTANNAAVLGPVLHKQIAALDPNVPAGEVQTLDEQRSRTLSYPRFRAILLGVFAGLALLLAGVGLYGVLSQFTAQRTSEFGVRMALGAEGRDLLTLVMRQGLLITGAGLAAGLVVSLVLTRFLGSLLYGVTMDDPWILAPVSTVLAAVALLAVYLPARKASHTDPMVALRNE